MRHLILLLTGLAALLATASPLGIGVDSGESDVGVYGVPASCSWAAPRWYRPRCYYEPAYQPYVRKSKKGLLGRVMDLGDENIKLSI